MNLKRVGILRGGVDGNYENSVKHGGDILVLTANHLNDKYKAVDILVDREGILHLGGVPIEVPTLAHKVDIVWNTLGPNISKILESFGIKVISTSAFSGVMKESRAMLEEHMRRNGVNMPRHLVLPTFQPDFDGDIETFAKIKAKEIHNKFPAPWIVRAYPDNLGMGVHMAKTYPELFRAILDGVEHGGSILIEEFITGRNVEAHSLAGFRGEKTYVFPLTGINKDEKEKVTELARELHQHLDANHYLNTYFTLHPKLGIYLTNVEFSPKLEGNSHLNASLHSVGARMHHMIEHILEKSIN